MSKVVTGPTCTCIYGNMSLVRVTLRFLIFLLIQEDAYERRHLPK